MAAPLDMTQVEKSLEGFTIPPRPDLLIQLQKELEKPEPNSRFIGQLISKDMGIAGFAIKVVNTPFFGLKRKIESIEHACMFLGPERVFKLVRSILLRYEFDSKNSDPFLNTLWQTSEKIADACMAISHFFGFDFIDEIYSIGMFHDAGIALVCQQVDNYPEILKGAYEQDELTISEYEENAFASSHEILGFLIAQSWGLSHEISTVIAYHHSCQTILATGNYTEKQMFSVLKLAEHMVGNGKLLAGAVSDLEWEKYNEQIMDILEIEYFQLFDIGEMLYGFGLDNAYHK